MARATHNLLAEHLSKVHGDNRCHACEVLMINGVRCHETGCPEAWREIPIPCFVCGYDFIREDSRYRKICPDCEIECC